MQKHLNLEDLVRSFPTNIYLQNLASIQQRTSPVKFAHLAEKLGKVSISNLSTKAENAFLDLSGLGDPTALDVLTQCLEHQDRDVRRVAVNICARIPTARTGKAAMIAAVTARLTDEHIRVVAAAMEAIPKMAEKGNATVIAALKALLLQDTDTMARRLQNDAEKMALPDPFACTERVGRAVLTTQEVAWYQQISNGSFSAVSKQASKQAILVRSS